MKESNPIIGFRINVIIEPDDDGFHAYCPALKGLHTYGSTKKEALQNAKDAAIAYLKSSIKHHDPIPLGIAMRGSTKDEVHTTPKSASCFTEDLQVACAI